MSRDRLGVVAYFVVFFLARVLVDTIAGHQPGGTSGWLYSVLFFASMLAGIPAIFFLGFGLYMGYMGRNAVTLSDLHKSVQFGALGFGFFVLSLTLGLVKDSGLAGKRRIRFSQVPYGVARSWDE